MPNGHSGTWLERLSVDCGGLRWIVTDGGLWWTVGGLSVGCGGPEGRFAAFLFVPNGHSGTWHERLTLLHS